MTTYLQYNDPTLVTWRKGDIDDPYVDKSEPLKIINNIIVLTEIPDKLNRVVITGYNEVDSSSFNGTLLSNQYIVNYQNGLVTFNISENGNTVTATYKGRGQIQYPAERIYTHTPDQPDTIQNLQTIIDNGNTAIQANNTLSDTLNTVNATNDSIQAAEAIRVTSENTRLSSETTRSTAESSRVTAESARVNAETGRASAESSRVTAESTRVSAESTRASAESARVSVESDRVTAETNRSSAESSRVTTETSRANAETSRGTAESSRASAESARVTAENTRVSSETSRENAESNRVTAESTRASAETTRQSNETDRINRDTAYQLIETYNSGHSYVPLNKVTYNGSTYQCILASNNNVPTNTTYWILISPKGDTGATGAQGIQGIQGIQGLKGSQWRGAYSGATTYVVDDVVSYNGSSYINILASTGNLPTNTTYFSIVALKGTDGTGSVSSITSANSDISVGGTGNDPVLTLNSGSGANQIVKRDASGYISGSNTFTGTLILPSTTSIGTLTSTELGYVHGVTSAIQTQLNAKAPTASPTFTGVVTAPSFTSTIATGTAPLSVSSATVVTSLNSDLLDGQHGSYYAVASTLSSHTSNISNPHSVTKAQVGLGSVDNTADTAKPVSTAQQTALNLKLDSSSYTAADVLTKIKTVDGAGSGLDADTVDGFNIDSTAAANSIATRDANANLTANVFIGAINMIDNRTIKPSGVTGVATSLYFSSLAGLNSGSSDSNYLDLLVLNGYVDNSGGKINALGFLKNSQSILHYQATIGDGVWGTPKTLAYSEDVVSTASYTAADVLSKVKTVDGAGSGLDADLLDGHNASTTAVSGTIPVYNGSAQLVGNITGNAATVTTNANMTGDITSIGNATSIASNVIVDADINSAAAISWSKISKTGSSLADLATKSATDLNSGTLNASHLPAFSGDITISAGSSVAAITAGVIVNADINSAAAIDATKIGTGVVTNTEFGYIGGLTSDAQTQLNAKAPTASPTFTGNLNINGTMSITSTVMVTNLNAYRVNGYDFNQALLTTSSPTFSTCTVTSMTFTQTTGAAPFTVSSTSLVANLNADLLDNQQGSYYLAASSYTAADVLAKIKTVDGSGSGLDADLLDGLSSGSFVQLAGAQTMTSILTAQNNTSYTTKQVRNITLSTSDPSGGSNGDIWIKYT